MKVEIEIKKKDLRRIFCAALRYYHRDLRSRSGEEDPDGDWFSEITDNLCEIRGACDTISNLCDLIEEVEVVDNDARGVIRFDDGEEQEEQDDEEVER